MNVTFAGTVLPLDVFAMIVDGAPADPESQYIICLATEEVVQIGPWSRLIRRASALSVWQRRKNVGLNYNKVGED